MNIKQYRRQTWVDPRQEFRVSPTHGMGAFARSSIQQGEVVEIVGGVVMTDAEFQIFQQRTSHYHAIQIDEGLHLVEQPEIVQQRAGGSLNHSCDPNVWMADEVTLVARRDIAAGEELTVDYGLFTAQPDWRIDQPCHCETLACRHTITGDDWQRPDLQERYYPHFSPFINARIEHARQKRGAS